MKAGEKTLFSPRMNAQVFSLAFAVVLCFLLCGCKARTAEETAGSVDVSAESAQAGEENPVAGNGNEDAQEAGETAMTEEPVQTVEVTKESQQLATSAIINARELGGYPAADGMVVKRGLLLRTAKLSTATEEDLAILKDDYHLGYVVDMRVPSEIGEDADPVIEGVEEIPLPIDITTFLQRINSAAAGSSVEERIAAIREAYENGEMGDQMYVLALQREDFLQQYHTFFQTLLKGAGEKAILWHCSFGKDRTGLGAAMLLSVLGVEEDIIMEDYLLTNVFYEGTDAAEAVREKMAPMFPDEPEIVDAFAELSGGVKAEYLQNAMDYMKAESGSVEAFVREKVGLSEDEAALLRSYYLRNP